jgi:hypothetical protein
MPWRGGCIVRSVWARDHSERMRRLEMLGQEVDRLVAAKYAELESCGATARYFGLRWETVFAVVAAAPRSVAA